MNEENIHLKNKEQELELEQLEQEYEKNNNNNKTTLINGYNTINNQNSDTLNLLNKENENENENEDNETIFHNNLNKIMNDSGYNLITFKIIFFGVLYVFLEGYKLTYFGSISKDFKERYKISESFLSFISSLNFLGMFIGNITISFLLKLMNQKKRQVVILCTICLLICDFCVTMFNNLALFITFRLLGSIFMGFYSVLIMTILTEYLPLFLRGFVLNFVWFGWSFGSIYFLLILKIFFPLLYFDKNDSNNFNKFNNANFSIVYIHFVNVILALFFFEDSPRSLFMNNSKDKAGKILKYYVKRDLKNEELFAIHYNLINKGENKHCKKLSDFGLLFSQRYLLNTIFTMLVFFFFSFSMYGMNIALPALLESKEEKEKHKNKLELAELDYMILFYSVLALSSFLGGVLSEIKIIGVKYSEMIVITLSFLITFFGVLLANKLYWIFTICALLIKSAFNLQISWSAVTLPTKFRTTGFGLFLACTRLGGFISQFAFNGLNKDTTVTIVMFFLSLIGIVASIYYIPKSEIEELDCELDLEDNVDDDNKEEKLEVI